MAKIVKLRDNGEDLYPITTANAVSMNDGKTLEAGLDAKQDKITTTNKLPYSLLSGTPTIPQAVTKTSQLTNDSGYITNSYHDATKANLSGATFTGKVTLPQTSGFSLLSNNVVKPMSSEITSSPFSGTMIWHDLLAFCKLSTPKYYTSADGSTWTEATLDKRWFWQRSDFTKLVLDNNINGSRWVWGEDYTMSWGYAEWFVLGVTYVSKQASYTVKIESSADKEMWKTLHESTGTWTTSLVYFKIAAYNGDNYIRLTLKKSPSDDGTMSVGQIRLLTSRYGNQGHGIDYEYPYSWDEYQNLTFKAAKINNVTVPASPKFTDTVLTESDVSGWGFTKNTGTYSKPSTGIPKTDLASAVQTSLGKADTALQSFTESDPTVPSHVKNITQEKIAEWNGKSDFSGNYNDLTNKPTIPSAVTEATVSGWGFTKNTGTYSKPSTGIPYSDLSNDVKLSLDMADSAITEETDPTVPSHVKSIKPNDITYWNGKQNALQSGSNIKTINGQSILGSGNISVGGGGVTSYDALTNLPTINGVTLLGNKTASDLFLAKTDTEFTISSSDWVLDATQTGYYSQTKSLSLVEDSHPTVMLAASGSNVLPTGDEQKAYDKVKYVTVDSATNTLKLYSDSAIATSFTIIVRGVTV